MKIFHIENGKEVVYVQIQDIIFLSNETDIALPTSISEWIISNEERIKNEKWFSFVKFDNEEEVSFFRKNDVIVDFNHYKNYSDEQIQEAVHYFFKKANTMVKRWNVMNDEKRDKKSFLNDEYKNIRYIVDSLFEIYEITHGRSKIKLPDFVED